MTVSLLNEFLTSAWGAGVFKKLATEGTARGLQDSIRQQLEQSGLIASGPSEGFSKLLSAAAEHLSAPPFHTLMLQGSNTTLDISTSLNGHTPLPCCGCGDLCWACTMWESRAACLLRLQRLQHGS